MTDDSSISATCSNGHDVLRIAVGTPCPECGDLARNVTITAGIAREIDSAPSTQVISPPSIESTAVVGTPTITQHPPTGSGSGTFGWTGHAEGVATPVVTDVQEVVLRWTPLDDETGVWLVEVRRDGEVISIALGDTFVRGLAKVAKDLYPKT